LKIVALIAVRNEELYIKRCLEHLESQGIETCIIDNGSTDRTLKIAESFASRGVFRIEHLPYNGQFELMEQLRYKEKLAKEINADWFIHQDADEIREAPKPFKTLKEGFEAADNQGFNAVNFDEFDFLPTTPEESFEDRNYVKEMKYYYFLEARPQHHIKAWKKTSHQIDLVSTGGHLVDFKGIKVFPVPFILRHYMALSLAHANNKYGYRKFSSKELAKGWHKSRKIFSINNFVLPRRGELKMKTEDNDWDRSDPWLKHKCFGDYEWK
jgi:glycosyltransferase involved in cell wall biosynthesis